MYFQFVIVAIETILYKKCYKLIKFREKLAKDQKFCQRKIKQNEASAFRKCWKKWDCEIVDYMKVLLRLVGQI